VYQRFRAHHLLAALLALVPFAYLVRMCTLYVIDVPLWDEWQLALHLDRLSSGTLTARTFWEQHNEHRPMFPVLILLTIARLTGWDVRWEVAANLAVGVGIFVLYGVYLRSAWRARGGAPVWLVPVISALAFSTVQWENWVWGWQMSVMLCALMSLAVSSLIARGADSPRRLVGAVACATCATYSFASGLTLWLSQLPGVWLTAGARRRAHTAAWLAAGAVVYASYFYKFERPYQAPISANFVSLDAVRALVMYVFTYVGTPLGAYGAGAAAVCGAAGTGLFVGFAVRLRALRDDPAYRLPVLIGLQTLATACVSGLGRAYMGGDQAMSSRYTTLSLPLWCAIVFLATLWWQTMPAAAPWRWRGPRAVTAALVAGVLTVSYAQSALAGLDVVAARSEMIMYARRALLTGKSDALLKLLFPVTDSLRERRAIAMRRRLSVFRPSAQPSYPLPVP
jgi:hypothetical protein